MHIFQIAMSFIGGAILTPPDCSSMGKYFEKNMTGKLPSVNFFGVEVLKKLVSSVLFC